MFDNARPISLLSFISKAADKMYCVQGYVCFRKTLFYGVYYRCIGKRKSARIWKKAKLFCQCFPIHPNFWHSRSLYYFQQVHLLRFFFWPCLDEDSKLFNPSTAVCGLRWYYLSHLYIWFSPWLSAVYHLYDWHSHCKMTIHLHIVHWHYRYDKFYIC